MTTVRIPSATYRLQLHAGFGFREAAGIAGYLSALGISDVYVSPVFQATPGSTHCYDVLDHDTLSPELGGSEGFDELCQATKNHGLGLIVTKSLGASDLVSDAIGHLDKHVPDGAKIEISTRAAKCRSGLNTAR